MKVNENKSKQGAIACKDRKNWLTAMDEEMKSLYDNNTWSLVKRPTDSRLVSCKWIFKIKKGIPGVERGRFKARLVARGFTQREGIDFNDVFSPVVKHRSMWLNTLLSLRRLKKLCGLKVLLRN